MYWFISIHNYVYNIIQSMYIANINTIAFRSSQGIHCPAVIASRTCLWHWSCTILFYLLCYTIITMVYRITLYYTILYYSILH